MDVNFVVSDARGRRRKQILAGASGRSLLLLLLPRTGG